VFTQNEITEDNGEDIDFVYFGLNNRFTRNIFVSPNNLNETTFIPIPNASTTTIINNVEACGCESQLTSLEFDNMNNDDVLNSLPITDTPELNLSFDNTVVPRIVVFKTADGRKGAIKVNRFVENSTNSYIEIDIKVQKEAR